jgi:hypothetical protein
MAGILLGGFCMMLFQSYPSSVAASRRADAQGRAILTIMLLSFSLYHRADLRGAVVEAADSTDGKLAEDLRKGLLEMDEKRKYETVRHLLTVIANNWSRIDDSTRQAIFDILRSTGTRDESARLSDIARAPARVLGGMEEQLTGRLGRLVMPTLAFLTFSSLAIIGIIGLSPLYGIIGASTIDIKFFILMCAILALSFWFFTNYMGKRRPVILRIPDSAPNDPDIPPPGKCSFMSFKIPALVPALIAGALFSIPGIMFACGVREGILGTVAGGLGPMWFAWAIAVGLAVYGYLYASPMRRARERMRREIEDWSNALNTMGSRMLDGKPAPVAMAETATLMEGSPLAERLKAASNRMEKYGMGLRESLFGGRKGENQLIESFISTISRIRSDSEIAAGRACMTAADYLATIRRVERSFRERIEEALGNLWLVAAILIPVVCAMSVWVMDFMTGLSMKVIAQASLSGVSGIPLMFGVMSTGDLAALRLLMGVTSIVLACIVGRYVALIRAGEDRVEMWSSITRSSLQAITVYTAAVFLLTLITIGL